MFASKHLFPLLLLGACTAARPEPAPQPNPPPSKVPAGAAVEAFGAT